MESVVIHYEKDGFKVSFYDSVGKLVDSRGFLRGRRITLDFSNVEEVRITPYSLAEGLMIVLKGVKEFKVLEVGGIEEVPGVEGGEIEEQE